MALELQGTYLDIPLRNTVAEEHCGSLVRGWEARLIVVTEDVGLLPSSVRPEFSKSEELFLNFRWERLPH